MATDLRRSARRDRGQRDAGVAGEVALEELLEFDGDAGQMALQREDTGQRGGVLNEAGEPIVHRVRIAQVAVDRERAAGGDCSSQRRELLRMRPGGQLAREDQARRRGAFTARRTQLRRQRVEILKQTLLAGRSPSERGQRSPQRRPHGHRAVPQ
ncbi:MAG: hypothetical protein Q8S13_01705, partial [Dehalococcoidia bacterium]|nr:hypothetical protein [Dehalococcoidia bacterium]